MAVTNRVANATRNFLMPKLVEGVLQSNVGLSYFMVRAKRGVWKGAQLEVTFKYQTNPNGSSFLGMDTLISAAVDNTIKLTYDCKFNYQDVALAKTDLSLNMTEEQVADLLDRQISSDTYDLADRLGTQFYLDGTGNSGKDLLGLAAIVDDGTSVATIGNQSRATYPALNSTVTASGGTLTLAKMYTMHDAVSFGGQRPDLLLTTKNVKSFYNQLLEPKEHYMVPMSFKDKMYMNTGADELAFRATPIVSDDKCTSGSLFMLNSNSFEFCALPNYFKGEKVPFVVEDMEGEPSPDVPEGLGFWWTGLVMPVNQESITGRVIHAGNFQVFNPRYNGKLTGITGI